MAGTERTIELNQLPAMIDDVKQAFLDIDYEPPLTEFLGILEEEHFTYFGNEKSPTGIAWPPLAASTVRKKGHDSILFEKGPLSSSLTEAGQGIRKVTNAGLLFGTDIPYSIFHQAGTARLPQREHVGTNDAAVDVLESDIADHAVKSLTSEKAKS